MHVAVVDVLATLDATRIRCRRTRRRLETWQAQLLAWRLRKGPMTEPILSDRVLDELVSAILRDLAATRAQSPQAAAAKKRTLPLFENFLTPV